MTGITGIDLAHYVVCDRCGHLWDIEPQWPDPIVCPACQHQALWRFPNWPDAQAHSDMIVRRLA